MTAGQAAPPPAPPHVHNMQVFFRLFLKKCRIKAQVLGGRSRRLALGHGLLEWPGVRASCTLPQPSPVPHPELQGGSRVGGAGEGWGSGAGGSRPSPTVLWLGDLGLIA